MQEKLQKTVFLGLFMALGVIFMSAAVADNSSFPAVVAAEVPTTITCDGLTLLVTGTAERWTMIFKSATVGSRTLKVEGAYQNGDVVPRLIMLTESSGFWTTVDDVPAPRSPHIWHLRGVGGKKGGSPHQLALLPMPAYLLARVVRVFCAAYWALPESRREHALDQRAHQDSSSSYLTEIRILLEMGQLHK